VNIKIQGGGNGSYSNTGSCMGTANYLEHEDQKQLEQGNRELFFTHDGKTVPKLEVVTKIDTNKGQLLKTDAKYFVLTISPSKSELVSMGDTPHARSQAMKDYITKEVMPQYARNFNKELTDKDIMYFAKVHYERGEGKEEDNLHAHIIISRKDMSNKKKLSPQTNHKQTQKGAIKGGFDRSCFFEQCEVSFDKRFCHNRGLNESYGYFNVMKNGTIEERKELLREEAKQLTPQGIKHLQSLTMKGKLEKLEHDILAEVKKYVDNGAKYIPITFVDQCIRDLVPKKALKVDNPWHALDILTNNQRGEFETSLHRKIEALKPSNALDQKIKEVTKPEIEIPKLDITEERVKNRGRRR